MFMPDGRKIISASSNGTALIWDADSGKELVPAASFRNKF